MKITVIGTGKLGLVTATSLAQHDHDVLCVDRNEHRVNALLQDLSSSMAPDCYELSVDVIERQKLRFSCALREAVASADTVVLAVDIPINPDGSSDLRELWIATDMLMYHLQPHARVVVKSVVPCGTHRQIADRINRMTWQNFDVGQSLSLSETSCACDPCCP